MNNYLLIFFLLCCYSGQAFFLKTTVVTGSNLMELLEKIGVSIKIPLNIPIAPIFLEEKNQTLFVERIKTIIMKRGQEQKASQLINKIITLQYSTLDESNMKSIQTMWLQTVKNKVESVILFNQETNQVIVRGLPEEVNTLEKYVKSTDRQTKRIKLDFIIVSSNSSAAFGYGFNWSGIYNKQQSIIDQHKNFGFTGLGGDLRDFPTPTGGEPDFPQIKVNPYNFSINLFTPELSDMSSLGLLGDPMLSLPIVFGGPDLNTRRLNILLQANELDDVIKVISRPSLIVQEHEVAKMFAGFNLPYYIQIINSTNNSVTNISSIEYQNVGTSIQVSVHVLDDGFLDVDLYLEYSRVDEGSTQVDDTGLMQDPPFLQLIRMTSKFTVEDGQVVMIAGVNRSRGKEAVNKVPYVHKLPLMGKLFKAKAAQYSLFERIVFVTASIIND